MTKRSTSQPRARSASGRFISAAPDPAPSGLEPTGPEPTGPDPYADSHPELRANIQYLPVTFDDDRPSRPWLSRVLNRAA